MNYKPLLLLFLTVAGMILIAGCTQSPPSPPVTTSSIPTTLSTTTTIPPVTVAVTTKIPEPVRTLPANYAVAVDVAGNGLAINPMIIATYRGGMGNNYVYEVEMQVTRADGVTESGSIRQPIRTGDSIALASSGSNTDSAQVWVTLQNGEKYKVFDEIVPFRQFH
jgi:hypothetical protein